MDLFIVYLNHLNLNVVLGNILSLIRKFEKIIQSQIADSQILRGSVLRAVLLIAELRILCKK